jgi:hypothetical protein
VTQQNDQDPGWWRRGMSRRATLIVVAVCGVLVVGALVFALSSGIPLF